jgi:nitrite reductase/ring-hydroxylating ferredoxin subunit
VSRADRRLRRYIDALLKDRRPRHGAAGDDLPAMQLAARLRAAHPGSAEPASEFVDELSRRLRHAQEHAPHPRRRQILVAGLATAAASVGAGVGLERLREALAEPDVTPGPLRIAGGRWAPVALVADLQPGRIVRFSESGVEGFVFSVDGRVQGVSAVCSDQGCSLTPDPDNARLVCPCHDASFGLDGNAHPGGYWGKPLPTLEVRTAGERVEVRVPASAGGWS